MNAREEVKSWKRSHSVAFWGGAPLKASHSKHFQGIDTIEVVTTSRAAQDVITRKKQAEQSAEQPAEKIGCLQDKSAGSESRLMRGAVTEQSTKWSVQSDVVIPDKLDNGNICNGLLRRFVAKISHLKENSPHNDMLYCHYEEKQSEHSAKRFAQGDVVIPDKNSNCHAEGAQATEASHNIEKRSFANAQDDAPINIGVPHNFRKRVAFTLAEVLITLAIIGIVAALTMPTLLKNVAERENSETQANIAQKITKSMDLMRADGGLERTYASTDDFVDELSKYLKISTRCDASHIANCWPTKTVTTSDGETYDVSKAKTGKNLNLKDNKSDNVGLILADGSSLILTYNPNAGIIGDGDTVTPSFADLPIGFGRTKKFAYTTSVTAPIDFVMDVNGFKGPNSETRNGKYLDIRSFKTAKFSKGCAGVEVSGVGCVYNVSSYTPLQAGTEDMKKYAPKFDETHYGSYNFWGGAKKACDDLGMSLPDKSTLKNLAKKSTAEKQKLGLPTTGWFWTSSENGANRAFIEYFDGGSTYDYDSGKNYSNLKLVCVGD